MFGFLKRWFGAAKAESVDGTRRQKQRVNARSGMRVLVVDDSTTVVATLRRMLEQNGYEVEEALNGEKGVELAVNDPPDLIFLDIILPGINGFAALRQLRRNLRTREVPVIMMSGNEQATEQFYAQRIGADDFIKKPFSRAELFSRIERLLDVSLMPRRRPPAAVEHAQGDFVK
ncbi:response regulator [Dokdonella sp.]|uniref:response regulator n=1 Tax=Dokdonella sp. TaxID=2291710 RepID=UPI0025C70C0F|nr:response regulator [Dokdonella sp.]MBX3688372.1 response regulator [Dokdonella sp.]